MTSATIPHFNPFFSDHRTPIRLCTNGEPQFTAKAFTDFLKCWKVNHIFTSTHHSKSNGHAEVAVKSLKHLISKVVPTGNTVSPRFYGLIQTGPCPESEKVWTLKIEYNSSVLYSKQPILSPTHTLRLQYGTICIYSIHESKMWLYL